MKSIFALLLIITSFTAFAQKDKPTPAAAGKQDTTSFKIDADDISNLESISKNMNDLHQKFLASEQQLKALQSQMKETQDLFNSMAQQRDNTIKLLGKMNKIDWHKSKLVDYKYENGKMTIITTSPLPKDSK